MSTKQGRALRLGAKLAEGQVYEVFELLEYPSMPIGARLVLKKIRPELAQDEAFRNRLHKLFELLPKLRHPYAEEVLDAKAAGPDETFLVCERLDGESLADLLRREGRLPLLTAQQLARQIAEALLAGHALCVIHGNLTPRHIVINQPRRDEPHSPLRIKVRGFGLAPPLGGPLYGNAELPRSRAGRLYFTAPAGHAALGSARAGSAHLRGAERRLPVPGRKLGGDPHEPPA